MSATNLMEGLRSQDIRVAQPLKCRSAESAKRGLAAEGPDLKPQLRTVPGNGSSEAPCPLWILTERSSGPGHSSGGLPILEIGQLDHLLR
jgi:hypothetical protein